MATTLQYAFVATDEEHGVLTLGFADDPFDTREYLLFQKQVDAEEGEDSEVYLERDDQTQGVYGGVERLILARAHALLLLSPSAASALGTEREVKISFSATAEQFQELKAGLEVMFPGQTGLELEL